MNLLNPTLWALWCACLLLLIAAVINVLSLKVPNRLSLPAILAGWLVALAISASFAIPSQGGGLLSSLAGTVVAFLLLFSSWSKGWLGAGCVKMQMAFGAWVGCAVDVSAAALVTSLATMTGGLLTAICAFIASRLLRTDAEADPQWQLFPAQVTFSLGSICGVVVAGWLEWI